MNDAVDIANPRLRAGWNAAEAFAHTDVARRGHVIPRLIHIDPDDDASGVVELTGHGDPDILAAVRTVERPGSAYIAIRRATRFTDGGEEQGVMLLRWGVAVRPFAWFAPIVDRELRGWDACAGYEIDPGGVQ